MSDRPRPEKNEKQEKQEEKDEKNRQEKDIEEKWRRDPLQAMVWAAILIWAGLVLLVDNLVLVTSFWPAGPWSIIATGAGLIVLAEAAVRYLVPQYRRPLAGTVIIGLILLGIGLSDVTGLGFIWALVLIAAGVVVLLRGFVGRR